MCRTKRVYSTTYFRASCRPKCLQGSRRDTWYGSVFGQRAKKHVKTTSYEAISTQSHTIAQEEHKKLIGPYWIFCQLFKKNQCSQHFGFGFPGRQNYFSLASITHIRLLCAQNTIQCATYYMSIYIEIFLNKIYKLKLWVLFL